MFLNFLFEVIFFNIFTNSLESFFFKTIEIFFDSSRPPLFDIIGRHFLLLASIAILPNGSFHTELPTAIEDFL